MSKVQWKDQEDLMLAVTVLEEVRNGLTAQQAFEVAGKKLTENFGVNRTYHAVAFRWNSNLKYKYEEAYEKAKEERKNSTNPTSSNKKQISLPLNSKPKDEVEEFISSAKMNKVDDPAKETPIKEASISKNNAAVPTAKDVLESLEHLKTFVSGTSELHAQLAAAHFELSKLQEEKAQLEEENKKLEYKNQRLEKENETLQEDYEAVLKVINKARKYAVEEETDDKVGHPESHAKSQANAFKMERNGNLTRV